MELGKEKEKYLLTSVLFFLGDFLLGVMKRLLRSREDIRLVLMSATINAELFSKYFDAPVIQVPGRMYPVRIEYIPIEQEDRNLVDPRFVKERLDDEKNGIRKSIASKAGKLKVGKYFADVFFCNCSSTNYFVAGPYLRILERIDQVVPSSERGDLLVFLSGMQEITMVAEELRNYASFTKYLSLHFYYYFGLYLLARLSESGLY
jgi:HrpA-like RNA helicase